MKNSRVVFSVEVVVLKFQGFLDNVYLIKVELVNF